MPRLFHLERRSFVPSRAPVRTPEDAPSSDLAELAELERILDEAGPELAVKQVCEVHAGARRFPVHAIALGNPDPKAPAVGFFGGVHGLERIGSHVVLAYLRSLVMRLKWDHQLHRQLETVRLVFMPIVNPGGMWAGSRSNPNGVDLMRNAPVQAAQGASFLAGGQRLSAALPWYRGAKGQPMEIESQALCRVVDQELLSHTFSLSIDCHSGFGMVDRIWFPHAHTARPIEHLPEMLALANIFDQAHPHHRYVIEPQSRQYLTHGDLWDHLYLRSQQTGSARSFLPLTLEMGSWRWVRKNPRQLLSRQGIFNPMVEHRQQRVLRQHMAWLDFLTQAASSHGGWVPQGNAREAHRQDALPRWYP